MAFVVHFSPSDRRRVSSPNPKKTPANRLHTNTNINWFNNVKFMFESNGFYEILLFPSSVNLKAFTPVFRNRLIDNYLTHWQIDLRSISSLTLFRLIKSTFDISEYLLKVTIPT